MSKTIPCKLAARKSSLGTQYVSLGAIILNFDLVGIGKKKKKQLWRFYTDFQTPRKIQISKPSFHVLHLSLRG